MPELNKFLTGFGLKKGMVINNCKLTSITGIHRQIIRYRKYEYDITLTFTKNNTSGILLSSVKNLTSGSRIINSAYGNPYECHFGSPYIEDETRDEIVIVTTGYAVRV